MFDGHWSARMNSSLAKAAATDSIELRKINLELANHYRSLAAIVLPRNSVVAL